jgi:hypothetical protein
VADWLAPEPADVRLADALAVLAETTQVHGLTARSGDQRHQVVVLVTEDALSTGASSMPGSVPPAAANAGTADEAMSSEAATSRSAGTGRHPRLGLPHVPAGLPGEQQAVPDVPVRIVDGPGLETVTACRLACDASIVALVEDAHGVPLRIGRRGRTVPLPPLAAARGRLCDHPAGPAPVPVPPPRRLRHPGGGAGHGRGRRAAGRRQPHRRRNPDG